MARRILPLEYAHEPVPDDRRPAARWHCRPRQRYRHRTRAGPSPAARLATPARCPAHRGGKATTLQAQVAGKPAVLVFYRGGWCPVLQPAAQRAATDPEAIWRHWATGSSRSARTVRRNWPRHSTRTQLAYTLLSDSRADALKAFGIGYRVDAGTLAQYKSDGIDLAAASGQAQPVLPVPSRVHRRWQRRAAVLLRAPRLPHPHSRLGGAGGGQGDRRAQTGGTSLTLPGRAAVGLMPKPNPWRCRDSARPSRRGW